MNRRTAGAAIALACASIVPLAGIAQAQDLDCIDFAFQEDAQAEFDRDPTDPHGLDEDRGQDDGIACEWRPRRGAATLTPVEPTPVPLTPTPIPVTPVPLPVTPTAVPLTPTVMPTRGAQGGIGGSQGTSDLETGFGIGLAAASVLAGGYALRRKLRSRT